MEKEISKDEMREWLMKDCEISEEIADWIISNNEE